MSPELPGSFDRACLEALKTIGKTLGQMGLYSAAHPSVRAMRAETLSLLTGLLEQAPGGELVYSVDQDRVIANGRVIGQAASLPSAVLQIFLRFKLASVAFHGGISAEELEHLCSLAALRPETAKTTDAKAYLAERGVEHIVLNEAIYAKVEKAQDAVPVEVPGAAAAGGGAGEGEGGLSKDLEGRSLEDCLQALVGRAVRDPDERRAVLETVRQRLREDIKKEIDEAARELRRAKTTLENEQTRTQAVFGTVAEGVIVVDDQGKVLMMNASAEEMFGTRLAEAAGKPLEANVKKDEHLLALAGELKTPDDRPIEAEVKTVSDEDAMRTLRASAAVIQNEAGKPVGMVSALSDAAKHRELQRMEREFVAHVTHELRAPLSSIRAALEILDGEFTGKIGAEQAKMMGNALSNTDRLEGIINEILDFSKIESGQMTVYPKPCNSEKIAQDAVESLRPWAMKKGVRLLLDQAPDAPAVMADPQRTVQVLVNLISNALKFTPAAGSVTVGVSAGTGAHARAAVYSVKDTGPGIAKQDQKKIFEKFIQISSGEKHVGGTGLGLAIAQALVGLQKGRMWVESDLGEGACFYFTLPRYEAVGGLPKAPVPGRLPWWKKLLGLR